MALSKKIAMVYPKSFCSNPETLETNAFQISNTALSTESILKKAQNEYQEFQELLESHQIQLLKFVENINHQIQTPDALFLNNWFCHLPEGKAFIFPMLARNRQLEFRQDIIDQLNTNEIIDLRYLTEQNIFLEGTGSLIFDHDHKIGYACYSSRTHESALKIFSEKSGYEIIGFQARNEKGSEIYHTNVMMAMGQKNVIINLSALINPLEKELILSKLKSTHKNILDISHVQMNHFVGNMLQVQNNQGQIFWICSKQAFENLSYDIKTQLETEGKILYSDLQTIETYGGGGARCMLAEVF